MVPEPQIHKLFQWTIKHQASGIRLTPGQSPRLLGKPGVGETEICPLSQSGIAALLAPIMDPLRWHALEEDSKVEFTHAFGDGDELFLVKVQRRQERVLVEAMYLGTS